MTRETKIGLLVGMGVIILIGILISDHLSMAQRQQQARVARVIPEIGAEMAPDPLVARARDPIDEPPPTHPLPFPGAVEGDAALAHGGAGVIRQQLTPPPAAFGATPRGEDDPAPGSFAGVDVTPARPERDASAPLAGRTIADDLRGNPHFVVVAEPEPVSADDRVRIRAAELAPAAPRQRTHHLKDGERLSDLAKHYYGDPKLWTLIHAANKDVIPNPDLVRAGVRLVIPPAPGEAAPAAAAATPAPSAPAAAARPTPPAAPAAASQFDDYTVQDGETLAAIAHRFYGKKSAWQDLYAINKDRIKNPDRVTAGMTIRVPKRR